MPSDLSGGMRKRAALARVIIIIPKLCYTMNPRPDWILLRLNKLII